MDLTSQAVLDFKSNTEMEVAKGPGSGHPDVHLNLSSEQLRGRPTWRPRARRGKAGFEGHFGAEVEAGSFVILPNCSAISVCAAQVLRR